MNADAFKDIAQSIYRHILGLSDLFKNNALNEADKECSRYLNFLSEKKNQQAEIIKQIAGAYGILLVSGQSKPALNGEGILQLKGKDVGGIFEFVRKSSQADLKNYSLFLTFKDDRKMLAFIIAVMDFERDFILDAQAGYVDAFTRGNQNYVPVSDTSEDLKSLSSASDTRFQKFTEMFITHVGAGNPLENLPFDHSTSTGY
jgi:hypothetical protein